MQFNKISETIAVVTSETRLRGLKRKRATAGAAAFVLEQTVKQKLVAREAIGNADQDAFLLADAAASFQEYEEEDQLAQHALKHLRKTLDFNLPLTFVSREHLPNFQFDRCLAVVVVGQDGLVANTAKYVKNAPIIGVNPDPKRNDGILVPFSPEDAREVVQSVIKGTAKQRTATLAEVNLNDGQRQLAFNDFYIGNKGHASSRYTISDQRSAEPQSSSGIIISTGAGSTGWMSSIFNMVNGVAQWMGNSTHDGLKLEIDAHKLLWVVREPFISRHSQAQLVAGVIEKNNELIIESLMPNQGVIFSDGVENDFLEFNSGSIARIKVSNQGSHLVVA